MDRRESLKALAIGSVSAGLLVACDPKTGKEKTAADTANEKVYGRTPEEKKRDKELHATKYFTDAEMATIAVLCNIIIPADDKSGSATDAKVPDFIEFIVKDQPEYQLPLRGGLKWLDVQSSKLFEKKFTEADKNQQLQLVDMIAYPKQAKPNMSQGVSFFNTMRNLTATGFFTSEIGIKDIGYKGNVPNAWDGVPDDVLKQYGLAYDEKTLAQCLKNEDRGKIMTWDDQA